MKWKGKFKLSISLILIFCLVGFGSYRLGLSSVPIIGPYYLDVPFGTASYYVGQYDNGQTYMIDGNTWQAVWTSTNNNAIFEAIIGNLTNSGGGICFVQAGLYNLDTNIPIIGWYGGSLPTGNPPTGQIIIEGEGWNTVLHQDGTDERHFVLTNRVSVVIKNLKLTGHYNTGGIFGDNTGANSEISCQDSIFENLMIAGFSEGEAGVHIINGHNNDWRKVEVNGAGDGMLLENDSAVSNYYGDGDCRHIRLVGTSEKTGLKILGTNGQVNLLHFNYLEITDYEYLLVLDGMAYSEFDYTILHEVENTDRICAKISNSYDISFSGGYVSVVTNGTAGFNITDSSYNINIEDMTIDGGSTGLTTAINIDSGVSDVHLKDLWFRDPITTEINDAGTRTRINNYGRHTGVIDAADWDIGNIIVNATNAYLKLYNGTLIQVG